MRTGRIAVLLAVLAMAAACGDRTATEPEAPGAADLVGRAFWSTEVTEGGTPRELAAGTRVSLRFTDDGRLIADAGCNSMQAPVEVDGDRLRMPSLAITEMGCAGVLHRQDRWLSDFLDTDPTWRLEGDKLVLTSETSETREQSGRERTRIVLVDRRELERDLPLRGTTWHVNSFSDGEVASSMADADRAWLRFRDGQVTGSTGCNQLGGSAEIAGDRIVFGPLTTTKRACTDDAIADLERRVLEVIDDATVTYEIDADSLTLAGREDHSLGLIGRAR